MPRFEDLSAADFIQGTAIDSSSSPPLVDPKLGLVLQIVKGHPDGISTSEVIQALQRQFQLKVSWKTIDRILKDLEHAREVYSRAGARGSIHIWYPNGRLVHPHLEIYREIRGKTYRVTVQEGRAGPAVQIQERIYSLLTGERVEGAIFIDYAALSELSELLNEIRMRYETLNKLKVAE